MMLASLLLRTKTQAFRSGLPVYSRAFHYQYSPFFGIQSRPSTISGSVLRVRPKLTSLGAALQLRFSSQSQHTRKTSQTVQNTRSSSTVAASPVSPPSVGRWLMLSSVLVFAVIVVGGVTRLTESGLSITEWRPITGTLPPLTQAEWAEEWDKYRATPEFKLLNHSMTLDEFKRIFYMEWAHRVLGRVIGVTFVIPLAYFALRKQISLSQTTRLTGLAALIGAQGLLGWYMVKSGLEDSLMDTPGAVPRVSQYRLAAHLGTAFVLYAGMFGMGLAAIKDWRYAKTGQPKNLHLLRSSTVKRFRTASRAVTGLVFLTALSGAFVAGLDAGLVHNEFPLMGGHLVPPTDELFSPSYSKKSDGSDTWWRNLFENPTTVQFNHRLLATTTYVSTGLLFAHSMRPAIRASLPPIVRLSVGAAFAMANVQALLGISTLLYLVPVPLAAAHQAGSVALLSAMIHLLIAMRRPGLAARMWRKTVQERGSATKRNK